METRTRFAALAFVVAAVAGCSRGEPGRETATEVAVPGALDLVGVAVEGQWNRRTARDRADDGLLDDLIALTEDPEMGPDPADDASIRAAEARLGVDLPPDFERVARKQHALGALGWYAMHELDRADALGDELGRLLRVEGKGWRERELLVEDLDGGSATFPAGDVTGYLVLGRNILGEVLLYDPSPSPQHACCVLIETPVIADDTPTAYPSVHDWLVTTWALQRAVD